ncbi:MAG: alanine--glyoxylate aminotransferase family protein [Firmicutes bacterium]|nr:alanine--glyoxylate aminotransferase family protein [Bacillota bacterium]
MEKDVLVMIPGPSPVVSSIKEQMARDIQAFGDPRFIKDYRELIVDLGTMFNCSGQAFPLAGTGTLAMEMAVANVTKRGDNVLVVSHGFFGDRFIEICQRKGLNTDVLSATWGDIIAPEKIEVALAEKEYAALMITHVDTSTAVTAPLAYIGQVVKKYPETLFIVDSIAGSGGEFADVDDMGIDILFTGSQKAFGVCPGMFVLWAGQKALDRREELGMIPEYYVDFTKWLPIMKDPGKYFATPAINLVWAMKEAAAIIREEGLAARAKRHSKNAFALHKGLEALNLRILAQEECRASTLSVAIYPQGIDDAQFRSLMWQQGVVVAGALGLYAGKAFRVGHMGNFTTGDMVQMLAAVEYSLAASGADIHFGQGVGAYLEGMK